MLDDGSTQLWPTNPLRSIFPTAHTDDLTRGDTVENVTAVLDHAFGAYRLYPLHERGQPSLQRMERSPPPPSTHLTAPIVRIATFNTNNYFNGHAAKRLFVSRRGPKNWAEYREKRHRLVEALSQLDADILALTEIENDGYGPQSSVADLTTHLAKKTNKPYHFARTPYKALGNDEIRSVILYNADKVSPMGEGKSLLSAPFQRLNRPPLMQTFTLNTPTRAAKSISPITLVVNHFKSKGRCPKPSSTNLNNQDHGEGCWSSTRQQAAQALIQWLTTHALTPKKESVVLLGDFNAHYFEAPLTVFLQSDFINAVPHEHASTTYTYNFRALSGQLDHLFLSRAITDNPLIQYKATVWHRFSDSFSINYRGMSPSEQRIAFDHDPLYIDIYTASPSTSPTPTP